MTSNDNPPSYNDVVELDELSYPTYNEINGTHDTQTHTH